MSATVEPRIQPNPNAVYPPATQERDLGDGLTITIPAPEMAMLRLSEYLTERYGYNEEGNRNTPTDDPLMADVSIVVKQVYAALATLEVMSMGGYSSTDDKPVYAGGVETPGNKIFTPQEAAIQTVEKILALDGKNVSL